MGLESAEIANGCPDMKVMRKDKIGGGSERVTCLIHSHR